MADADGEIDMTSFRDRPFHEDIAPIVWLHGVWRSENGIGTLENRPPFTYAEELQFSSVGQPGLSYTAFSWSPEKKMPMHQESGFLRIEPGTNNLALILAQNIGLAVIEEGEVTDNSITLFSKCIERMRFTKGSMNVTATKRVFNLKSDDELEQIIEIAVGDLPLAEHLRATYKKVHLAYPM